MKRRTFFQWLAGLLAIGSSKLGMAKPVDAFEHHEKGPPLCRIRFDSPVKYIRANKVQWRRYTLMWWKIYLEDGTDRSMLVNDDVSPVVAVKSLGGQHLLLPIGAFFGMLPDKARQETTYLGEWWDTDVAYGLYLSDRNDHGPKGYPVTVGLKEAQALYANRS